MSAARKALIVASDTYEQEGLRSLRSPRADASALAAVLGDPHIGDFEVSVVHNQPSYEVQARVEELFADSRPDDVLLLHFACHGLKSESGELFFATRNTRLGRLASSAVSADFVQRCMRASRSRSIVLLLDCCYGGAFGNGVAVRAAGPVGITDSFPAGRLEGGRGRAVITASNAMEYAFEGETLAEDHSAPSVFTEALVRGLSTGEADRDEDGWVSLDELYEYVFDQVRTSTPGQTPTRDVEMQGELYIARSRRRRVQPGPLPPDLLAASTDANVFSRLGAVSELRARLLGDNLPAAAGAHLRLTEIADTDIRYVAAAASAALAEGSLHVQPARLDFGTVRQGAPSPDLGVRLTGSPLARTCSLEPSDARLRLREDAGGVQVSIDTSRVGVVDGALRIRGSTGEVLVPVHADITAPVAEPAPPASPSPPDVPAAEELPPPVPTQRSAPAARAAATPAAPAAAPAAPAEGATPAAVAVAARSAVPTPPSARGEAPPPTPGEAARGVPDAPVVHPAPPPDVTPGRSAPEPTGATTPGPPATRTFPAGDATVPLASADGDRSARLGGLLAVTAAVLLTIGAFGPLYWELPLRDYSPASFPPALVTTALVLAAGALALWQRTRWPVGTGVLLGVVASSTWHLVSLASLWSTVLRFEDGTGSGFWLLLGGQVVVLAAGLAVLHGVVRRPGIGFGSPVVAAWLVWSLVLAGAAGTGVIAVAASRPEGSAIDWVLPAWLAVLATAVPVTVALTRPARFGGWLLVGWVVGAAPVLTAYVGVLHQEGDWAVADVAVWAAAPLGLLAALAVLVLRRGDVPAGSTGAART